MEKLLKMSLKLSGQEMKEFDKSVITEERKKWLQEAIATALENDDGKKLIMYTEKLFDFSSKKEYTEAELTELSDIFEQLNFLVEGMDVAKDFNILGGLKLTLTYLKMSNVFLQWRAADLIGNCAQNNPTVQSTLLENHGLETILFILRQSKDEILSIKGLYALSALIGNHVEAKSVFLKLNGINILICLLNNENIKVKTKSAFLIRKIIQSENGGASVIKFDMSMKLLEVLKSKHNDSHEIIAHILLEAMKQDETVSAECKQAGFMKMLQQRKLDLHKLDAKKYEDEISIYNSILQLLQKY